VNRGISRIYYVTLKKKGKIKIDFGNSYKEWYRVCHQYYVPGFSGDIAFVHSKAVIRRRHWRSI